jgi:hypothetical protein
MPLPYTLLKNWLVTQQAYLHVGEREAEEEKFRKQNGVSEMLVRQIRKIFHFLCQ